ncbi:MAG: hypothetical protein KDA52_06900 [Planctomycetaceae bacterium]|nr:hypothetical protein [Planctomycetaceae bacterium]
MATESNGELILNGSFESNLGNGSNPDHWLLITNSFGAYSGVSDLPDGGSWALHVGAVHDYGGRYQDIATTFGQSYHLSFWGTGFPNGGADQYGLVQVGTPGSVNNSLALNNNAEYVNYQWTVPRHEGPDDWVGFNFTFTAATTTTRISFQNIWLDVPDRWTEGSAVNVDLVSVTLASVPEPDALLLACMGMTCVIVIGGCRIKRRHFGCLSRVLLLSD